ncbi:MAG: Transketolase, central region [Candidatus Giovannonibacteria bacterium GW2011_GWB1_43_13]|nr:MAG: Transketolase, central region [Candidatus Giovannonibacteria bacterium GW2011_GWB1_43_13]
MTRKTMTFADAIDAALEEEMAADSRIFVLGEDILDVNHNIVTKSAKDKFPKRFISTPLIEDMLGDIGLGMNLAGLKPILNLDYGTFVSNAFNSLYRLGIWRYRTAEKSGPAVIFRISHYGYLGRGAELAASFLGAIFHLPNIVIATPAFPHDAYGLLKTALQSDRPVVFFEHKKLYDHNGIVPNKEYMVPFGSSTVLKNGTDVTLIAWSFMSHLAMSAANILDPQKINTEVIILHTINPMDMETVLNSARKTKRVIIIEEDMLRGGIGAEISTQINIGQKYENLILPSIENIVEECRRLCLN